jgi:hypothetical protein
MEVKIMYGALIFIAGWLYFYICLRQLIYDFTVGFPLISKFGAAGEKILCAKNARRLNIISVVIWAAICVGLAWVTFRFCPLYLLLSFWAGVLLGVGLYIKKMGPRTKSNFEAFCRTYYRFMPDEELRAAAYEGDLPRLRAALRALECDLKFEFNKD